MKYPHWQYYLSLVDDVDRLSRFVELANANFGSYSVECTRILLAASAEIDVVAKVLCEQIQPSSGARSITTYAKILLPQFPRIVDVEVSIPRAALTFKPWEGWTEIDSPVWWKNYQGVKHERHNRLADGNLGNAVCSVAGLCVLVSYLYYHDFIQDGLGVRRPFIFLDAKYNGSGKRLRVSPVHLPDFA